MVCVLLGVRGACGQVFIRFQVFVLKAQASPATVVCRSRSFPVFIRIALNYNTGPPGTYNNYTGATSPSDCKACDPGALVANDF